MKLLIVGLGSMGKRRARLAKGIDASIELCGVDLSEERRTGEEVRRLGIDAYPDIPSAVAARHPDAALVCTAPSPTAASSASCWTRACPCSPS